MFAYMEIMVTTHTGPMSLFEGLLYRIFGVQYLVRSVFIGPAASVIDVPPSTPKQKGCCYSHICLRILVSGSFLTERQRKQANTR